MRPIDQAHERLRRANPVPNPAALLAELTEAKKQPQEGNKVSTVTTDSKTPPRRKSRGWVAGPIAAVVVLVLGGAAVFLAANESPFADSTTPVEIAEAYIDARNDYDSEGALELVSDDFTTTETPSGYVDASTLERAFQFHEIQGFEFTDVQCEQTDETAEGVMVSCNSNWSLNLHRVGNFPIGTDHELDLLISNGEIVHAEQRGMGGPQLVAWTQFLETEHRAFLDVWDRAAGDLDPAALQTLSERMTHYLDLWRDWLDAQAG